jgi:cysteine desulfurase
MAYFDWNATAPLAARARAAWLDASERLWANASTPYRMGAQARLALDGARERLARLAGCAVEAVVFTSGATEASNGWIREAARRSGGTGEIWISAVEHPSVREAARLYWGDARVRRLAVTPDGQLDLERFSTQLKSDRPAAVSVMAANNETGVIQPWQAVRDRCREAGVAFHCDAVQWFGKVAPPDDWAGCAGVTLSGHKVGGPKGVGCLILGPEWQGIHLQTGGAQEHNARAGTENLPAILGMVAALEQRQGGLDAAADCGPRDRFEARLQAAWPEQLQVHGAAAPRLWNTCSLALPEFDAARWIARLDRLGFQVSSGAACSSGKSGPSPILAAMGVEAQAIRRTIRISGGWETTDADWQALLQALRETRDLLAGEFPSAGPGRVIEI